MFRKTYILDGVVITTGLALVLLTAPAFARSNCTNAPAAEWKPVHEIAADAANLGYVVKKIEREGTCYEVEGRDRHGAKIEILYDPQTGKPAVRR